MRVVTLVAALFLFTTPSAHAAKYDLASQDAAFARLDRAWQLLAGGSPREAYRAFRPELDYWNDFQRQSFGYVDAQRGMMIAAIFARDDAAARAAWGAIAGGAEERPADSLVFAGRWNAAFRAYRDATLDLAAEDPRAPEHDRVVTAGVERAVRGDFAGAIAAWSRPAVGRGGYDLTDVQTALIGLAYARERRWNDAETAWLHAARIGRTLPQIDEFHDGNLIGLSMLYHFRDQFRRGEHAYRWTNVPART